MFPKKVDMPLWKAGSRSTVSASSVSFTHQAPHGSRNTSTGLRRARSSMYRSGSRRNRRISLTFTARPSEGRRPGHPSRHRAKCFPNDNRP